METIRYLTFVDSSAATGQEVRTSSAFTIISNSTSTTGEQTLKVGSGASTNRSVIEINGNNNGGSAWPELIFYDGDAAAGLGQGMGRITFQNADSGANGLARIEASVLGGQDPNDGSRIAFLTTNSSGVYAERLRITETGFVQIHGAYTLPVADGTVGQVLTTDGSGAVTFADAGGGGASALTIEDKTSAYTVVTGDLGKVINCTTGTFTVTLTAAATLGSGFNVIIWNTGTGVITVDPDGTEKINELLTLTLQKGEGVSIICTGTEFQTGISKLRLYSDNTDVNASSPIAAGDRSVAIGAGATTANFATMAIGYLSLANQNGAVALGYTSNATGAYSLAISGNAGRQYTTAIGVNSGGSKAVTATGDGAMALGGSYASGTDSFAAAIGNNTSSYGATGANSVAIGNLAKATGADSFAFGESSQATAADAFALGRTVRSNSSYAVAMGYNCLSSANYSVALGYNATASGSNAFAAGASSTFAERATASGAGSVALGGAYATANDSVAIGASAKSLEVGKISFSNDNFSAVGDSQHGLFVLRIGTTDATPKVLTTNNTTGSNGNQILLPVNSAYAFHGTIVARQQASQGTACAAWKIEGLIRREGSAGTTVLVNSATTVLDNTPAWGMALSADTINGGLKIEVTGAAATNIRWVATIHTSEVTY